MILEPERPYFEIVDSDGVARGKFQRETLSPIQVPDDYPEDPFRYHDTIESLSDAAVDWDNRLVE